MDAKVGDAAAQKKGYEPSSDLIQEQDCDTLLIYLPSRLLLFDSSYF